MHDPRRTLCAGVEGCDGNRVQMSGIESSTANVCLSTIRVAKTFTVLHAATVLDTTTYSVFVKESCSVFSDAFFRSHL